MSTFHPLQDPVYFFVFLLWQLDEKFPEFSWKIQIKILFQAVSDTLTVRLTCESERVKLENDHLLFRRMANAVAVVKIFQSNHGSSTSEVALPWSNWHCSGGQILYCIYFLSFLWDSQKRQKRDKGQITVWPWLNKPWLQIVERNCFLEHLPWPDKLRYKDPSLGSGVQFPLESITVHRISVWYFIWISYCLLPQNCQWTLQLNSLRDDNFKCQNQIPSLLCNYFAGRGFYRVPALSGGRLRNCCCL